MGGPGWKVNTMLSECPGREQGPRRITVKSTRISSLSSAYSLATTGLTNGVSPLCSWRISQGVAGGSVSREIIPIVPEMAVVNPIAGGMIAGWLYSSQDAFKRSLAFIGFRKVDPSLSGPGFLTVKVLQKDGRSKECQMAFRTVSVAKFAICFLLDFVLLVFFL